MAHHNLNEISDEEAEKRHKDTKTMESSWWPSSHPIPQDKFVSSVLTLQFFCRRAVALGTVKMDALPRFAESLMQ
jgi:hypothetical protein